MKKEFVDLSPQDLKLEDELQLTRAEHQEIINFNKMRDYYNSCIPDDIRIFSVKRVTRKFHAMFLANLRL
jgi:tRNA U38,U39,U40 pseudouridine synthase TruA